MEDSFSQKVIEAIDAKNEWYDENSLMQMRDDYRLLHTCVKNLFDILVQKSLITPDPYRIEKKISEIVVPSVDTYAETDRALIIGARLSDYESTLDYIGTYYKFSVDTMNIAEIKKLTDFNNCFLWAQFTQNNSKPNTSGLAIIVSNAKSGAPTLTVSAINDILSKCSKTIQSINSSLRNLAEYQKEAYKCKVRKTVLGSAKFDKTNAFQSIQNERTQIKKLFTQCMGKEPYYTALIEEILNEDQAPNKEELQEALLKKLQITETRKDKKDKEVDTKAMIMAAVHSLSSLAPQLETVCSKLNDSHIVLENEQNTFFDKLKAAFRKAFNLKEPPVIYNVVVSEKATGTKRKETIDFTAFLAEIRKKATFYNSFSLTKSAGYAKIEAAPEEKILEFLNKQYHEIQRIMTLLIALDEYLKQAPTKLENRSKIKGLSMEFTTMKNILVNTNQLRGEYLAYIEEQTQMKKLGIIKDGK